MTVHDAGHLTPNAVGSDGRRAALQDRASTAALALLTGTRVDEARREALAAIYEVLSADQALATPLILAGVVSSLADPEETVRYGSFRVLTDHFPAHGDSLRSVSTLADGHDPDGWVSAVSQAAALFEGVKPILDVLGPSRLRSGLTASAPPGEPTGPARAGKEAPMAEAGIGGTPTVAVELPAALAEQLQQKAAGAGESLHAYLHRLVQRDVAHPPAPGPNEAWVARWRGWTASRPKRNLQVDDSREAIYEGSGE